MSKAEENASKLIIPKQVADIEELCRFFYIKGYQQAEKDLELTWEDVADILDVTDIIANDDSMEVRLKTMSEEEYCQEVLKRFKEKRNDNR